VTGTVGSIPHSKVMYPIGKVWEDVTFHSYIMFVRHAVVSTYRTPVSFYY
jgi:hypothetical protein